VLFSNEFEIITGKMLINAIFTRISAKPLNVFFLNVA
jgi:hypothetical protein